MVFGDQATAFDATKAFPQANTSMASGLMELGKDNDIVALRTDAAGVPTLDDYRPT